MRLRPYADRLLGAAVPPPPPHLLPEQASQQQPPPATVASWASSSSGRRHHLPYTPRKQMGKGTAAGHVAAHDTTVAPMQLKQHQYQHDLLNRGFPVTFDGLSYTVQCESEPTGRKQILDNVSGHFLPGKLTALMGPPGSGKVALMEILSGRQPAGDVDGTVLVDGNIPSAAELGQLCSYVERFDFARCELTIGQMLMHTAECSLNGTTAAERRLRVGEVMSKLGLQGLEDSTIDDQLTCVTVSIAQALISRPKIIFLDDPTSGLDAHMANEVARFLRTLAEEGLTVVCTIQSPTSFAFGIFDDLVMLADGSLYFKGPFSYFFRGGDCVL